MAITVSRPSAAELQATIDAILARYPWFAGYPVTCHATCARWEIDGAYGADAGDAWYEYAGALWLLTGDGPGKEVDDRRA